MIDLTGVKHHPTVEEIVTVLCNKTENTDTGFFRPAVAYFLGKMAATMRATIITRNRGQMPVNIYTVGLATSGYGKGYSVNLMEDYFTQGFRMRFMEETLPTVAENNLWDIANNRALRNNSDPQEEKDKLDVEYKRAGSYAFAFDDGTVPAVKQLRTKLLLSRIGAINFQVDEIGSNLEKIAEMLNLYFELYDQGIVKQKLTKNTNDNQRGEEVEGKTPANMLLFGTPFKLLDGGKTEDLFYSLLETGYARRCLFGFGNKDKKSRNQLTAEEIYANQTSVENDAAISKWADYFHELADPARYNWRMELKDPVAIELLRYKIACEQASDLMKDTQTVQKVELEHRFSKALKLAGVYAFVDGSNEVEMDHLKSAILLVEESGESFQKILHREKLHVRLGRFLADMGTELTQHDLTENLSFYKGSSNYRSELMTLATSWGYTNNIIIKRSFMGNVEFFKAETLAQTDLSKIKISYSDHWAYNNIAEEVPFEELHNLAMAAQDDGSPMHWANHHFKNGHRTEENAFPGFNLLVLDVDGGVSLPMVHEMFKDYRFLTYTTKRHTEENHRFRLVLPINYILELDAEDYKEFMNNIFSWLPFKTDESSNQRSKKWETFAGGTCHYNTAGSLFDALPFIPKTRKNEEYRQNYAIVENLDNLERWFARRMITGNRNKEMIKYALSLVDLGLDLRTIREQVYALNKSLPAPLDESELSTTIMKTVAQRLQQKAAS